MSHALGDELKAEPNLVPLLDLVFQLIMFFMITMNFVSAQLSEDIKLPIAQSARAMDKAEAEVLILNLEASGKLQVIGQPVRSTAGGKRYFLKTYYADAKRSAEAQGDRKGHVKTTVIIRADRNANYEDVFELMSLCKEAGFKKLQLRAYTRMGG
ncbi:MAG TPA: biopolymer transporter ExbD [Gemmataceae bacterium]|nr:biopolymer transporter ExbD [Gemmataceae bacterium]